LGTANLTVSVTPRLPAAPAMSDSSEVMNLRATSPTPDLDGLLARSPIAMLLADDQRRYVDVNEAACALLGLRRAELLQAGVDGLIRHPI
jgi:PAS domain-containing protein